MPQPATSRTAAEAQWAALTRPRASASSEIGGVGGGWGLGFGYEGAGRHGTWFKDWPARLMSADLAWLPSRFSAVARTRDLIQNEVVAGAAINRRKNAAVGRGWRFASKPDALALGCDAKTASDLGRRIETDWRLYAYGHNFPVDAERKLTFGQLLRVAASHLMADGEFLGVVEYAADEPTRWKTRLRMVDPDRLSNPFGQVDGMPTASGGELRGGVEHDVRGAPVRYWIRERHPFDIGISTGSFTWSGWARFATALGRPQVLHGFDPERAGQTRGVTRFAAVLKSFRAFAKFTDATLQNATVNALILGYIQSADGVAALNDTFTREDLTAHEAEREEFYGKHPVQLGDAVFPALPLGDKIEFATAARDVTSFDAFTTAIIRLIAASLGVTYEEISMDYSKTNYSSARAAMIHAWAETLAFMGVLEDQLARPLFVAWLEEWFDEQAANDNLPAGLPDFYDAIDAYAQGRWFGPGRGAIDPVKEILAAAARMEAGVTTLEDECAAYDGGDWEERLEQKAVIEARRTELQLPSELVSNAQAAEDVRSPFRKAPAPPTDQTGQDSGTPAPSPAPGAGAFSASAHFRMKSALAEVARIANTAEHEAFLDARPPAAQAA